MASPIPLEIAGLSSKAVQSVTGGATIFAYSVGNPNAYPVYVKFYDKLAVNVNTSTDVPLHKVTVPAATLVSSGQTAADVTWIFATAVSIRCTSVDQDQDVTSPATSPALGVQLEQAGGGSGAVASVNAQVGTVVLAASDVGAQPVNSGLTSISALTTTSFGRGLLTSADAAGLRTSAALGTSATLDVPASGDATSGQVAKGSDSRLTDSRTPTTHAASHASGGGDPLTLAESQITNLGTDLAAKAPTTRSIATTAPLTGGGNLSADRTFAIPAATASTSGYLTSADWSTFSSSGIVTVNAGLGGTLTINPAASPLINRVLLNSVLTSTLTIVLPPAASYGGGTSIQGIEVIDIHGGSQANFGILVSRSTTDTIDGGTSISLPRAATYQRFTSNGSNAWFSQLYYTKSLSNPSVPAGVATFNAGGLSAARNIFVPDQDSVLVVPTNNAIAGVVTDINADGSVSKGGLSPTNIVPIADIVGTAGSTLTGSSHDVPATGTIDTVWIAGSVTGSFTINLPQAIKYSPAEPLKFIDFSGSVSSLHPITIVPQSGDTINNSGASVSFTDTNGHKILTSDGANNWSCPSAKLNLSQGFNVVTASGGAFTMSVDASTPKQNMHVVLASGANILAIPSPFDGMAMELVIKQPPSGSQGTLSLPSVSLTAGTSGVITLSSANSAIDRLRGSYDANIPAFLWDSPILAEASASLPTAPSALTVGVFSAVTIALSWTNGSGQTSLDLERSTDNITFMPIVSLAGGATSYTDSTVSPNTTYYYKIAGVNSAGSSSFSSVVSQTTSATCSSAGDTNGTGGTSGFTLANAAGAQWVATRFTATSAGTSVCRIDAALFYVGTPPGGQTITIEVRADAGAAGPGAIITNGTGSAVNSSSIVPTTFTAATAAGAQTTFTFSPSLSLTNGTNYWVAMHTSSSNGTNHPGWSNQSGLPGIAHAFKSSDGTTWNDSGSGAKLYLNTFH